MPSLKTIRKRIGSVKSTQKITRAMKMVAGARLNRAQARITALRPYAIKTQEILNGITRALAQNAEDEAAAEGSEAAAQEKPAHRLLARRPAKKILFVVASSDRGLCGGFNANIVKLTDREWKAREAEGATVTFATVGKKAREQIQRKKGNVVKDFPKLFDGLDLEKAKQVSDYVTKAFLDGEVDAVYLLYTEFKSAITQKPTVQQLLPITPPAKVENKDGELVKYDYEPNEKVLLSRLVPMYVEISVYRALLDSQASELGARMTAMDAATRNAKDMIGKLTLVYNRARQAAITKELMEIIGGAEALK
jgi:F-type H+-transporting ATPase subunit gamma